METTEFKVGDTVHTQVYASTEPLQRQVDHIKIGEAGLGRDFQGTPDNRIFYHLKEDIKQVYSKVSNITTSEHIVESKYFKTPVNDLDPEEAFIAKYNETGEWKL